MAEHDQVDLNHAEQAKSDAWTYDQVYLNSIRETRVLLVGFVVFLVWTIVSSMMMGYGTDADIISSRVLGMPRWVFWGVLIPWIGATLFTFWFAWFFIANDALASQSDAEDTTNVPTE